MRRRADVSTRPDRILKSIAAGTKPIRRIALCCILSVFIAIGLINARAADNTRFAGMNLHQWGSVTLFHGLPSDHARAIAQDAAGALWFGTDNGLAKYDGRRTQKIAPEGTQFSRVSALRLDSSGRLWVGTDHGAFVFHDGKAVPVAQTTQYSITSIISSEGGTVVLTSEQGYIFIISSGLEGGIQVQQIGPEQSDLFVTGSGAATPLVLTSALADGDGLLIGTQSRGIIAVKGTQVEQILSSPRPFFISSMERTPDGRVWYGADRSRVDTGLYEAGDLLRPRRVAQVVGAVTSLGAGADDDLWAGTDGQGAFLVKKSGEVTRFTVESTAGGLRSNRVLSVFVDRERVVWFGTDRGVCRYDPQSVYVERISDNAESNFVRTIHRSPDGTLWCGTNRGLFSRRSKESVWNAVGEIGTRAVFAIAEPRPGQVLVGTANGLFIRYTGSEQTPEYQAFFESFDATDPLAQSAESVRAIAVFRGETYVATFGRGVERLKDRSRILLWPVSPTADPKQREVVCLHNDGSRLWLGTAGAGIFVFDGNNVVTEPALQELATSTVRDIDGAADTELLFATTGGLAVLREGQLSRIIDNVEIRSVAISPDKQSVWCATAGSGLFKAPFSNPLEQRLGSLDTEHGLPSNNVFAVSIIPSDLGRDVIWAATNRGVAFYEPSKVPPLLHLIRAVGKRAYAAEEVEAGLTLEYPQNSLVLETAAVSSRTFPEQFHYAFSLLDDSGRVVKRLTSRESQLVMEGLRPGRYRVEALAYSNDLIASQPVSFTFQVAASPFPWTTTALSVLLATSLFVLWWGYRQNRRIARTNLALETTNLQLAETRMQLASETENERRRISRDLHDQTLADLRRLMMLTDQLSQDRASEGNNVAPETLRSEIESISTEIRRICEDLSPSVLANVGLPAALEWALSDAVAHMPADRRFEYVFEHPETAEDDLNLAPIVEIQIYRILQEAISNVCRHANAKRVVLSIRVTSGKMLEIVLKDDGSGFDASAKGMGTSRGLTNIKSRASLIEGQVKWESKPGEGTVFVFQKQLKGNLPVRAARRD